MHIITWHDACLGKGRMIIWLHLDFLRGKIGGWYDRIERSSAKCDGANAYKQKGQAISQSIKGEKSNGINTKV